MFPTMPSHHTVQKDLDAAGIEKRTDEGVACFHSLRHTFTTIIARQTGDPRLAQRLADHADITTTQRYLHTERSEHAEVMKAFPVLRATRRATPMVQIGSDQSLNGSACSNESRAQASEGEELRPNEPEPVVRRLEMEPGGIEPPSRNSQQEASTRVVRRFISASRAKTDTLPVGPAPGEPPRRRARLHHAPASPMSSSPAPSGVRRGMRGFKPRERTAVRQL